MTFANRIEAGHQLADKLAACREQRPLVLAIPRGAVPMAQIISKKLGGELDVVLVRKLGFPGHPEFAMGSVSEEGDIHVGSGGQRYGLTERDMEQAASAELKTLKSRRQQYTPHRQPISPAGRVVILVDDGIATGATVEAAVRAVKDKKPARIIVATPVASSDAVKRIEAEGVEVFALEVPDVFYSVGQFYDDFTQVSDSEVIDILRGAEAEGAALSGSSDEVIIEQAGLQLKGFLRSPDSAKGVILFAHGSGSGRHSPRNQSVASVLERAGFATLLMDLLEEEESQDRRKVFDIELLAHRLVLATEWLSNHHQVGGLSVGYFGASTGAGAALQAAAMLTAKVKAVVSRGGRPDLAMPYLAEVEAPTLLIIGGQDRQVIEMNEEAFAQLHCEKRIEIVPGAGHLFEEPGALERVAELASAWFEDHLAQSTSSASRSSSRESRPSSPDL